MTKFITRKITKEMAARGYNNEGRGKLIGYVADVAKHERLCGYRMRPAKICNCRIGLWQDNEGRGMTDPICRLCQRPLGQHSMDTADTCNTFLAEGPDDIVGHKTFATGERDENGLPIHRHEPLTRAEGEALWRHAQRCHEDRVARMPDEKSALQALHDAYTRLRDMGWRDAIYCPKDGSTFEVIEVGSTGIHRAHYHGEWPTGGWSVEDAGDLWPSHPCLFRLLPEAQAEYDAKRKAAAERYRAEFFHEEQQP